MRDSTDPSQPAVALAEDWITLWHSELAALACDREAREMWQLLLAMWAATAGAMLRAGRLPDAPTTTTTPAGPVDPRVAAGKPAGAAAAAGTPTAAAASAAGLDEIGRLTQRVAELERRLAAPKPRPARKH